MARTLLLGARIRAHQTRVEERNRGPYCMRDLREPPLAGTGQSSPRRSRSTPSFSRFHDEVYVSIAEELGRIPQRIVAMCRDSLSSHARVLSALGPALEPLPRETVHSLLGLASATPAPRVDLSWNGWRVPRRARTGVYGTCGIPA